MTKVNVSLDRLLSISWFLIWRSLAMGIAVSFVTGILGGLVVVALGISTDTITPISNILGMILSVLVLVWVVSTLFEKEFSGFRIVLVRPAEGWVTPEIDEVCGPGS